LNLLIRLEDRYEEIMGYFEYGHVPSDNNQAERDLRMMRVREKICLRPSPLRSGCGIFRSEGHSKAFCDLRSVIASARKQSLPMLETLTALIRSPTQLGERLADGERT
jgi:transposase